MATVKALSFDCYGTLVDWETGILESFRAAWSDDARPSDEDLLEHFASHESRLEAQIPILPYVDVLRGVIRAVADDFSLDLNDAGADAFAASIADWPLYADTLPALEKLSEKYHLVILSNVDKVSFAGTQTRLSHLINAALIAEETGAYKPSPDAFIALTNHMQSQGVAKDEILHVAQSLYHDHAPAKEAGIVSCWVDRRADVDGWGAVIAPEGEVQPPHRIRSLNELPEVIATIDGTA